MRSDEERFDAVLSGGLPRLEDVLDRAASSGGVVSGDEAFRLYDTYGLPRDFIEDMVDDRKLTLDREGFERAMESQREKARAKSSFKGAAQDVAWKASDEAARQLVSTGDGIFRGYETTMLNTQVLALFDAQHQQVESLAAGDEGFAALAETPFYLEAGGQVSDVGRISSPQADATVTSIVRVPQWPRLHAIR